MKKPIKRIVAKEIIIFFSSFVIVGLICLVALGKDELRIQKSQRLNREMNHLSNSVDSLKRLFPKAISFERMIIGDLPEKYKVWNNVDKVFLNIDSSKIVEINLNKLYNLLYALDYHFISEGSGWLPLEVFSQNIIVELNNSKPEKKLN